MDLEITNQQISVLNVNIIAQVQTKKYHAKLPMMIINLINHSQRIESKTKRT